MLPGTWRQSRPCMRCLQIARAVGERGRQPRRRPVAFGGWRHALCSAASVQWCTHSGSTAASRRLHCDGWLFDGRRGRQPGPFSDVRSSLTPSAQGQMGLSSAPTPGKIGRLARHFAERSPIPIRVSSKLHSFFCLHSVVLFDGRAAGSCLRHPQVSRTALSRPTDAIFGGAGLRPLSSLSREMRLLRCVSCRTHRAVSCRTAATASHVGAQRQLVESVAFQPCWQGCSEMLRDQALARRCVRVCVRYVVCMYSVRDTASGPTMPGRGPIASARESSMRAHLSSQDWAHVHEGRQQPGTTAGTTYSTHHGTVLLFVCRGRLPHPAVLYEPWGAGTCRSVGSGSPVTCRARSGSQQ